jgi:hypothetical protein
MSFRVDKSQEQGRWRQGHFTWDLGHQKKKHQKNQTRPDGEAARGERGGSLYNAKGDLVAPASSLHIDI